MMPQCSRMFAPLRGTGPSTHLARPAKRLEFVPHLVIAVGTERAIQ